MPPLYAVQAEVRDDVEVYSLFEEGRARVEIAPALGNSCFLFECDRLPVLEPVAWDDFRKKATSFGIPILFPFANRIRDGVFDFGGRHFKVDPPRHGFVRDKKWKVTESGASDESGAWLTSVFDAEDHKDQILKQFPFPFRIEVTYRLFKGRLTMHTLATNTGPAEMPSSFGIHPYFRLPKSASLTVPASQRWELVDSLPTGKVLPVEGQWDLRKPRNLPGLQFDDILTSLASDDQDICKCVLTDHDSSTETVVEFDARQFPDVVVYTTPAPRQAICIEPNTSPTDAFNSSSQGHELADVVRIAPQQTVRWLIAFYTRPAGVKA